MNSNQGPANEQEPSSSFSISTNTPMYITPSVIKKVKQEQTQEETQVESVLDKKITGNQISEEESTYVNNSIEEGASSPEGNEPQEFNMVNVNQAIGKKPTARSFTQRNAWGNVSYADLITRAIMSSPNKRMTLQEIYAWISDNIPYFMDKKNGPTTTGWKNSVRHTLSIRKRFIRLPNMAFGSLNYKSLWTVDPYAEVRRQNSSTHRLHYQVGLPRLEVANWRPQLRVWTARPLDRATQTEFRNTCCSYCGHPLSFNYNTGNQFTQDS